MNHKYIVNNTLHFTEEIQNEVNTLVKFIYANYPLDYDLMVKENNNLINGSEYDHGEDNNRNNRYIDYDCNGKNNVKYHYNIPENLDDCDVCEHKKNSASYNILNELIEYFSDKTKQFGDLKFTYNTIDIANIRGINSDSRGVKKLDWHLLYKPVLNIVPENGSNHITLLQFVDSLYDIKSHKFENWYELYCGCDALLNSNTLIILCDYDHGS